jgi:hypothetical protein
MKNNKKVNNNKPLFTDQIEKYKKDSFVQTQFVKAALILEDKKGLNDLLNVLGKEKTAEIIKELFTTSAFTMYVSMNSKIVEQWRKEKNIKIPHVEAGEEYYQEYQTFISKKRADVVNNSPYKKFAEGITYWRKALYEKDQNQQKNNFAKAIEQFKSVVSKCPESLPFLTASYEICRDENREDLKNFVIKHITETKEWGLLSLFYQQLIIDYTKQGDFENTLIYSQKALNLFYDKELMIQKVSDSELQKNKNLSDYKTLSSLLYNVTTVFKDFNPELARNILYTADKLNPKNQDVSHRLEFLDKLIKSNEVFQDNIIVSQLLFITKDKVNPGEKGATIYDKVRSILLEMSRLQHHEKNWQEKGLQLLNKEIKILPALKNAGEINFQYFLFALNSISGGDKVVAQQAAAKMINMMSLVASIVPIDKISSANVLIIKALKICICDDYAKNDFTNSSWMIKELESKVFQSKAIGFDVKNLPHWLIQKLESMGIKKLIPQDLTPNEFKKVVALKDLAQKAASLFVIEKSQEIFFPLEEKEPFIEKKEEPISPKILSEPHVSKQVEPTQPQPININLNEKINELKGDIKIKPISKILKPQKEKFDYKEIELLIETDNADLITDPKVWNRYFEIKKKILISNKIEEINEEKNDICWVVDKDHIYSTKEGENHVIKVEKLNKNYVMNNYYVIIDSKIKEKISTEQFQMCQKALANGIKFIKNDDNHKIIELWIKEDLRLATTTIYKQKNGQSLIILDKKLNHETVKTHLSPLEIIYTEDEYKVDVLGGEEIGY